MNLIEQLEREEKYFGGDGWPTQGGEPRSWLLCADSLRDLLV